MNAWAEHSAVQKFRWRILTPIVLLIVLSSLDRVNISFAALQMNDHIGLNSETYGFAVGMFFVGYLLFQFPSTQLLTRIGARRWITACVVLWGTVATLMAFVRSPIELYALRFLLGAAESGFAPGIVYYTSSWMPQRHRANTVAITMLAIPISVVIGGPLCGWLMQVGNPLALAGWRWMLLLEGAVTIVMGLLAYFIFVDKPADAFWLTLDEKSWIKNAVANEEHETHARHSRERGNPSSLDATATKTANAWTLAFARVTDPKLLSVFTQSRLWIAAGVWAATLIGANGLIFWLPQVLKEVSKQSELSVGILSALPWTGVAIGMWFNSQHSDKTQERYWHVGVALLMSALALYGASLLTPGVPSLALLFLCGLGLGGAQGVFWAIPTRFLSRDASASGITLINLVGNVGSLVGPYVIGLIRAQSTSFAAPIWFVATVLIIGMTLLAILYSRRNESVQ